MFKTKWPRWLFSLLLFIPTLSFAADPPNVHSIDQIIKAYQTATQTWEPVIHKLTLGLFWGLVIISFTWSSIKIALKDGGIVDVLADLVTRTMTIGVSVWLLNEAPNLARTLINSFQYIGNQLSGGAVKFSPGNILELAMNIISIVYSKASTWEPLDTLMFFLTSLIILICFALIAMDMTVLIVSAYITVSGGIVMMGFLGSEWTREHAINYFTAVLGVALKMFVMQLIIMLGYNFIRDWCTGMDSNSDTLAYLALLGVSVVFYGLVREIPQIAASLASGRFTQGNGAGAMASMIQTAVTTAASMAAGAALAATGIGAEASAAWQAAKGGDADKNDEDSMKRALDTGPDNPGSPVSGGASAPQGDSPSAASSPLRAGMKAAAKGTLNAARATVGGAVRSVANQTTLGRAMAQAGVKPEQAGLAPEQKSQIHDFMMKSLKSGPSSPGNASSRDDGNDPNNYRDTLDEDKHHKR
ncbi:P-type conjugative transfer protein TrbL [Citrobacter koseri]|uniref:P-type conjugative transfer protein TrbL n=1 Tax=Citrobacter koseri TaxID=545 RepID=UPI001F31A27F|nr:P-type conjugative transfer protein TrbL [Citrobacter koseri]